MVYKVVVPVQSFPVAGKGKWQISKEGGVIAKWRRDGRELFYESADGRIVALPVAGTSALDIGAAVPLFEPRLGAVRTGIRAQYDIAPDGQRFLLNQPRQEDDTQWSITVVLNWTAGLRQ